MTLMMTMMVMMMVMMMLMMNNLKVAGIITRKDLMGFAIEEKL